MALRLGGPGGEPQAKEPCPGLEWPASRSPSIVLSHWLGVPWGQHGLGVNTAAGRKDSEAVRPASQSRFS